MHPLRFTVLAGAVILALGQARAADVTDKDIQGKLTAKQCDDARTAIEAADNREAFLDRPYGSMVYGASICCSSAGKVTIAGIDGAKGRLEAARGKLGASTDAWLDQELAKCERLRDAKAASAADDESLFEMKVEGFTIAMTSTGKVLANCEQRNLSPVLAATNMHDVRDIRIVPGPEGAVEPPGKYLDDLRHAYVGDNPQLAVCAPFVALSDSQDPRDICRAAGRFLSFFEAAYDIPPPLTWIALIHYPGGQNRLYAHAEKSGKPNRCRGTLGYFDWQDQTIVWTAPRGLFGTFNHELTHALMFWDSPLLPRWFDEGFAALYENSAMLPDGRYRGIENPWRQELLKSRHWKLPVRGRDLLMFANMSPMEFEADSLLSTVARESIRRLQDCGALPGMLNDLRAESRSAAAIDSVHREFYQPAPDGRVAAWKEIIERHTEAADCR